MSSLSTACASSVYQPAKPASPRCEFFSSTTMLLGGVVIVVVVVVQYRLVLSCLSTCQCSLLTCARFVFLFIWMSDVGAWWGAFPYLRGAVSCIHCACLPACLTLGVSPLSFLLTCLPLEALCRPMCLLCGLFKQLHNPHTCI